MRTTEVNDGGYRVITQPRPGAAVHIKEIYA